MVMDDTCMQSRMGLLPGARWMQCAQEEVEFKIQYGKGSSDVKRPYDSTVGELKAEIEKTLGLPSKLQKLMYKVRQDPIATQSRLLPRACMPGMHPTCAVLFPATTCALLFISNAPAAQRPWPRHLAGQPPPLQVLNAACVPNLCRAVCLCLRAKRASSATSRARASRMRRLHCGRSGALRCLVLPHILGWCMQGLGYDVLV